MTTQTSWREREDERHELVVAISLTSDTSAAIAGVCKVKPASNIVTMLCMSGDDVITRAFFHVVV